MTGGIPAGAYRLCSINSSSNHQPVIVPVAQHGSLDDCVYVRIPFHDDRYQHTNSPQFTATAGGAAAGGAASGGAAAGGAANGGAATGGAANNGTAANSGAAGGTAKGGNQGTGGKAGNGKRMARSRL